MLTVNTNVMSLNAQRNLTVSQGTLATSLQRLSSGLRINSARDDAAGLAISNRMEAQIRGMNQAARNANDAISMAQTAEGALQEVTNMLQRMRELAIQAANDTNSGDDRISLDAEFQALDDEIDRIATQTTFNGVAILSSSASYTFQVGANSGDTISATVGADMTSATLGTSVLDITTQASADTAIAAIDTALSTVDSFRADLGALQSRFESTVANVMSVAENVSAARSRVMDADFALETANLTKAQILQQAGVAMLSQANQIPQLALALLQ